MRRGEDSLGNWGVGVWNVLRKGSKPLLASPRRRRPFRPNHRPHQHHHAHESHGSRHRSERYLSIFLSSSCSSARKSQEHRFSMLECGGRGNDAAMLYVCLFPPPLKFRARHLSKCAHEDLAAVSVIVLFHRLNTRPLMCSFRLQEVTVWMVMCYVFAHSFPSLFFTGA